jgi:hypothetical protein
LAVEARVAAIVEVLVARRWLMAKKEWFGAK